MKRPSPFLAVFLFAMIALSLVAGASQAEDTVVYYWTVLVLAFVLTVTLGVVLHGVTRR